MTCTNRCGWAISTPCGPTWKSTRHKTQDQDKGRYLPTYIPTHLGAVCVVLCVCVLCVGCCEVAERLLAMVNWSQCSAGEGRKEEKEKREKRGRPTTGSPVSIRAAAVVDDRRFHVSSRLHTLHAIALPCSQQPCLLFLPLGSPPTISHAPHDFRPPAHNCQHIATQ